MTGSGQAATQSEVLVCLNALTRHERAVLLDFARFMSGKFCGKMNDRDGEDLLHHAVLLALDNTRKWYPDKVDFLGFIKGCISSIADGWRKRGKHSEPADTLASPTNQQAQTEAALTIIKVRDRLRGHPHAVEIFDLMMQEGYTGREIQERLGITPAVFGAAYKWIFRTLKAEGYRQ